MFTSEENNKCLKQDWKKAFFSIKIIETNIDIELKYPVHGFAYF